MVLIKMYNINDGNKEAIKCAKIKIDITVPL